MGLVGLVSYRLNGSFFVMISVLQIQSKIFMVRLLGFANSDQDPTYWLLKPQKHTNTNYKNF